VYLLILARSPGKGTLTQSQQSAFAEAQSNYDANRLIIPKIELSQEIQSGDASVLDRGVWHRFPERGDPLEGGNMILSGHRYIFAWLPWRVVEQSRFYNMDKLEVGDSVLVNWEGKQYDYTVSEKKTVSPNDTNIEGPSLEPKLTIYTCTLDGQADGRVVIIAQPKR
jgi:LPXTG-site transpeptidase (sortase) family protein